MMFLNVCRRARHSSKVICYDFVEVVVKRIFSLCLFELKRLQTLLSILTDRCFLSILSSKYIKIFFIHSPKFCLIPCQSS